MADSVFINKRSAVHAGSTGQSTAFPDVNLCPPGPPAGPVPTPLPNLAQAKDLDNGASSVVVDGNPMAVRSSYIGRSTGNAVARTTGGGLVTHVVEGKAYFTSFSTNVIVEGEEVPRHLDIMTHNHASPPGEAVGCYVGTMDPTVPAPPCRPPAPRSRKDQARPRDVRVYIGAPAQAQTMQLQLRSEDGRYDVRLPVTGASGARDGRVAVTFPDVRPGKRYSLHQVIGGARLPVFTGVPFETLLDEPDDPTSPPAVRPLVAVTYRRPKHAEREGHPLVRFRPAGGQRPSDFFTGDPERTDSGGGK